MSTRSIFLSVFLIAGFSSTQFAVADWKDDIGWTRLKAEIGALEDGTGIVVSQIEAAAGSAYMPDTSHSRFTGKTFTDGTGTNSGNSGHARTVGFNFYANTSSIAPGITEITNYSATDWIDRVLGYDAGGDPLEQAFKVSNHSYIGNGETEANATDILQRVDYVVNENDISIIVGTNNSGVTPQLLVPAYNTISVGRSDGGHAKGLTTFYGAGRVKPEIVGPDSNFTSFTTPRVAGAAAILHENGAGTDSVRNESIKAILLAGATKKEFSDWDRTTTQPLDNVYGAGELNIRNSYYIQEAGQFEGSTSEPMSPVGRSGWDYEATFDSSESMFYNFNFVKGAAQYEASFLMTWNIDVIDSNASTAVFDATTVLANFDMRLYDSTGSFMGTLLDSSLSTVDNIEHIYVNDLATGLYTLEITGDMDHDFALAWRINAVPEPSALGFCILLGMGICLSRRRTYNNNGQSKI